MILIRPITPSNVSIFKEVRLRALQDAPYAFSATYEKESQFTDAEWLARTQRMDGERGIGFLAMESETGCGIVGSFLDAEDAAQAHLISMWTAPTHRNRGVGRQLVTEVLKWARGRNVRTVVLMVTSNNDALSFYQQLGFTKTGRTKPYPNDSAVIEYEMSLPVS